LLSESNDESQDDDKSEKDKLALEKEQLVNELKANERDRQQVARALQLDNRLPVWQKEFNGEAEQVKKEYPVYNCLK